MPRKAWLVALAACSGCITKPRRPSENCWDPVPTSIHPLVVEGGWSRPYLEANELWYTLEWTPDDHDLRRATDTGAGWDGSGTASVNSGKLEDDPVLDGNGMMWFSSNAPDAGTPEKIVEVQRTGDLTFGSRMEHIELGERTDGSLQPSVSADGRTIYFSTDGSAISRATRAAASGLFNKPDLLASPHRVESPSIASDGVTIYFTDHDQIAGMTRLAQGQIDGTEIVDIERVGEFQTSDQLSYADPYISRDGSTLAFTISDSATSQLAYVRACPKR